MKFLDTEYIRNYLDLALIGVSKKRSIILVVLETFAALLTLISLGLFGLVIQLLLDKSFINDSILNKIGSYFAILIGRDGLGSFELILIISSISLITVLGALITELYCLKLIRKTARKAYENSLTNHIIAFRDSSDSLILSAKSLKSFRSSFTIDAHITFVALEAILKCLRPVIYIIVFSIAVLIMKAVALLIIFCFVAICLPILVKLNRRTLASAKSVLGEQRKAVYAELVSYIDQIDLNEYVKSNRGETNQSVAILSENFDSMLDSFDSWKLSSDKANYILQIIKVLGVHFAVVAIGFASYSDNSIHFASLMLLALVLSKLFLSTINLLTRLTVLSRLFPVVNRYLTVVREVALNSGNEISSAGGISNDSHIENIWIGLAVSSPLRKSEIGNFSQQLKQTHPNFDLATLLNQESGKLDRSQPDQHVLNSTLAKAVYENHMSDDFRALLEKIKFIDTANEDSDMASSSKNVEPDFVWKRATSELRLYINYLSLLNNDVVKFIVCEPAFVECLREMLDKLSFTKQKPILTFDKGLIKKGVQPYDMTISLSTRSSLDIDQLALI